VVSVDPASATVTVGPLEHLLTGEAHLDPVSWVDAEPGRDEELLAQMSAHGVPVAARWCGEGRVEFAEAVRRVAPGQSVVLYRGDRVVGGGPVAG
jgi:tRNA-specific 2-thiouridylase